MLGLSAALRLRSIVCRASSAVGVPDCDALGRFFEDEAFPRGIGGPDSTREALSDDFLVFVGVLGLGWTLLRLVVFTVIASGSSGLRITLRGMDSREDSSKEEFSVEVVVAEDVSSEDEGIVGRLRVDVEKNFVSWFIFAFFGIPDVYLGSSFFCV